MLKYFLLVCIFAAFAAAKPGSIIGESYYATAPIAAPYYAASPLAYTAAHYRPALNYASPYAYNSYQYNLRAPLTYSGFPTAYYH